MKPSLRNLFMKKLTRDRVVPIISASVSWLIFAITGSGVPSLPKFANSKSRRASRFFQTHDYRIRHGLDRRDTLHLPGQTSLTEEFVRSKNGDDRFLALFGN